MPAASANRRKNPDARQNGQERGDVLPGKIAVDEEKSGGGTDQRNRHNKDQPDATAAGDGRTAVDGHALRTSACLLRGHIRLESVPMRAKQRPS